MSAITARRLVPAIRRVSTIELKRKPADTESTVDNEWQGM